MKNTTDYRKTFNNYNNKNKISQKKPTEKHFTLDTTLPTAESQKTKLKSKTQEVRVHGSEHESTRLKNQN